jgi:hypothetical protein
MYQPVSLSFFDRFECDDGVSFFRFTDIVAGLDVVELPFDWDDA